MFPFKHWAPVDLLTEAQSITAKVRADIDDLRPLSLPSTANGTTPTTTNGALPSLVIERILYWADAMDGRGYHVDEYSWSLVSRAWNDAFRRMLAMRCTTNSSKAVTAALLYETHFGTFLRRQQELRALTVDLHSFNDGESIERRVVNERITGTSTLHTLIALTNLAELNLSFIAFDTMSFIRWIAQSSSLRHLTISCCTAHGTIDHDDSCIELAEQHLKKLVFLHVDDVAEEDVPEDRSQTLLTYLLSHTRNLLSLKLPSTYSQNLEVDGSHLKYLECWSIANRDLSFLNLKGLEKLCITDWKTFQSFGRKLNCLSVLHYRLWEQDLEPASKNLYKTLLYDFPPLRVLDISIARHSDKTYQPWSSKFVTEYFSAKGSNLTGISISADDSPPYILDIVAEHCKQLTHVAVFSDSSKRAFGHGDGEGGLAVLDDLLLTMVDIDYILPSEVEIFVEQCRRIRLRKLCVWGYNLGWREEVKAGMRRIGFLGFWDAQESFSDPSW
ncbi:hypothetical protein HK097_004257 [Rhizophlyctis rosea]|uniref:F-box domain-containing protein n=1 Tax=Rhizophlyctis rosea TaxID=64517 RepID=A0AAD5SFK1_9FUNG|nr:hypothetical protein HK097_004257 [Rhizophlyctis rosea]